MRLLRLSVAGATALVFATAAGATHDPNHHFSGNWAIKTQTPIGEKTGTISFRAVTPAEGEAAIQAMGVSRSIRNQYCWASSPGQYYVGTYDGGIGEGYSLSISGTPAPRDGKHAGCMERSGFGETYKGWFENSNPAFIEGQVRLNAGGGGIASSSSWYYGDFGGQNNTHFLEGSFTGHFPGDGAENNLDSDGDGLPDKWETQGYDHGDDGTIDVPLPRMGADPRHKDVFVELDMMLGHHLQRSAIAQVVSAFAKAPVSNPDGRNGITLHVDMGPGTVMNPATGATWGSLSRSSVISHQEVLGSGTGDNYRWDAVDAVKAKEFPPERAAVFHYAISIHRFGSKSEDHGGISRGFPAGDFLVATGAFCAQGVDCQGTEQEQATTFMHELGHNLGLRHGGDTHVNYKPNYFSIMNYAYQLSGLDAGGSPILDFSNLRAEGAGPPGQAMSDLDENDLDEGDGFGPFGLSAPRPYESAYDCDRVLRSEKRTASIRNPVDWNCNAAIDSGRLRSDVNDDGKKTVLTSFDDWSNLVFKGGAIGSRGAPPPPRETPRGDAPVKELVAAAQVVLDDAKPPTIQVKGKRRIRAKRGRVTVWATDQKEVAALTLGDGRQWGQFFAQPGAKRMAVSVFLRRPGVYRLTASASDRVGNDSKTVRFKITVGRGARRAASLPARVVLEPAAGARASG